MNREQNARDGLIRAGLMLIGLILPVLIGFVIYAQWSAPALDCALDWQTGVVLDVAQDSLCNYAGLMPGDIILSVNGVPFAEWKTLAVENQPVEISRDGEHQTLELPILPLAQVNFLSLLNALIVTLIFWGVGSLLLWRRNQQFVARLFFLMTQSVGAGLLFFLAYPLAANRPDWMAIFISIGFHLAGALALHFYLTFPIVIGNPRQRRWTLSAVYSLMLVALVCRLSDTWWGLRLSFLYNTLELIGAVVILVYAYLRRATPDSRRRLRLVVLGGVVPLTPAFFFYLLPTIAGWAYRMPDWMVGPLIIISPLGYLLAIVRDNLFDIDRVLNRALVYAILSLGILALYLGPFLLLYRFLPGDVLAQIFIVAALTLLVGLSFDWTRARVQRLVDRFFYGGWYDYPGVVETISDALARCIERAQLTDVLTRRVPALMQLNEGALQIEEQPAPLLPRSPAPSLEFSLAFQEQPRARWRVGAHRNGEDFTDADRRILTTIARQAETALGNVLLVETLRAQLDEIRASRATLAQAQHQLLRSREDERARLARDLHDGPIQDLVGLNMQLGLLLADEKGAPVTESLASMRGEVRALLGELRQVCTELRPPMLDTLGLGAALRAYADEWSAQHNVAAQLDLPPDATLRALPAEVAVNLFRVAQEVLSNAARHARAHNVTVQLAFDDTRLALTIRDDGCGFAPPPSWNDLTAQGHFGLVGLHERVALIGGQCAVESAPGKGTIVQVTWSRGHVVE
ncbi:MAG: histidine kinase [Chloroflexota bacterium]